MNCTYVHVSIAACVVALALAPSSSEAQVPSSAFGAPSSSLHGGTSINQAPARGASPTPAWTPRNVTQAGIAAPQPNAVQHANLPADLAKLNDSAIIIIGGKPTAAGEVKRSVLALDDKAVIIVGGKQVAAAAMKRDLAATSANRPAQSSANAFAPPVARTPVPATAAPTVAAGSNAGGPPRVKPIKVPPVSRPIASPKRLQLVAAYKQIRNDQDRLAEEGLRSHATAPVNTAAILAGGITHDPHVTGTEQVPRAGIFSVNNHFTTSPHLTPGGKVGIWGMGFGQGAGAVILVGGVLDKSPINLQIVRWTNDTIEAAVPGGTRGVPDVNGAVLQVSTTAGKSYRFDNVSFVAAREEQTITDPQKILPFVQSISSTSPWKSYGQIGEWRSLGGTSIDCPAIGSDKIHFATVHGFDAIGATMVSSRTDSGDGDMDGNSGSRVFSGNYSFGDWVNQDLQVNWGVFRSHTSPHVYITDGSPKTRLTDDPTFGSFFPLLFAGSPPFGILSSIVADYSPIQSTDPYDICVSGWAMTSLTVWGPAGVAP